MTMNKEEKQQIEALAKEIKQYLKKGNSIADIHVGFAEQGLPESVWAQATNILSKKKQAPLLIGTALGVIAIGMLIAALFFLKTPENTELPEAPISKEVLKKISEPTKITLPESTEKQADTRPKPVPRVKN